MRIKEIERGGEFDVRRINHDEPVGEAVRESVRGEQLEPDGELVDQVALAARS